MGVNKKYTQRPCKWNEEKEEILIENIDEKNGIIAQLCKVSIATVQKKKIEMKKKIEEEKRKSKFKLNDQYSNINQDKILERADEIIKSLNK